jgi:hypothetical protein
LRSATCVESRLERGAALLYCVECGCCSGDLGKGWTAFVCRDPDELDPPVLAVYCPPCAAAEFGYRPDVAAKYVCAWDPLRTEIVGEA